MNNQVTLISISIYLLIGATIGYYVYEYFVYNADDSELDSEAKFARSTLRHSKESKPLFITVVSFFWLPILITNKLNNKEEE